MISVSNEFQQALLNRDQPWVEEIVVIRDGVPDTTLGPGAFWENGIVIEDSISAQGTFALGGTIMNKATITLNNLNGQFDSFNFYNAELLIYIGLQIDPTPALPEMIQKGAYWVRDVRKQDGLIIITAYDRWVLFDKPFSENTMQFSMLAGAMSENDTNDNVIKSALADCYGIGYNVVLPHNLIVESEPQGENLTYRDVLRYIAEATGCFLKFNNEGILKAITIDWYNPVHINGVFNRNLTYNNTTISGISLYVPQSDQSEYTVYSNGTDEEALVVRDNFLVDDSTATTVLGWLTSEYMGRSFPTGEITHLSDPCLEAGDMAYIPEPENPGWYREMPVTTTTFSTAALQVTSCAVNDGNYFNTTTSNNINVLSNPSVKQSDIAFNVQSAIGADSQSVTSNTATDKGSFTLAKGVYSVTLTVIFGASATGNRRAWLASTSGGSPIKTSMEVHVAATASGSTHFQLTCYLKPKRTTTYYLVVQQNSGSTINCTARLAYMGIKL